MDEVRHALNKTKRGKAPREDGITSDMLKDAEDEVHNKLAQLFTQCLCKGNVNEAWCNAIVNLLHKKCDKKISAIIVPLGCYQLSTNYSLKSLQIDWRKYLMKINLESNRDSEVAVQRWATCTQ